MNIIDLVVFHKFVVDLLETILEDIRLVVSMLLLFEDLQSEFEQSIKDDLIDGRISQLCDVTRRFRKLWLLINNRKFDEFG